MPGVTYGRQEGTTNFKEFAPIQPRSQVGLKTTAYICSHVDVLGLKVVRQRACRSFVGGRVEESQ
jgi:hypothetical protein